MPETKCTRQNGAAIREIRQREGMSVEHLASATTISTPHLRNIELEHKNASVEHLARIARALNTPLAAIRRDVAADGEDAA